MQPSSAHPSTSRRLPSLLCCSNVDILGNKPRNPAQQDDDDWHSWRSLPWSQPLSLPSRAVTSVAFDAPPASDPFLVIACTAGDVVVMTCATGAFVSRSHIGSKAGGGVTCACGDGRRTAWLGARDGTVFCMTFPTARLPPSLAAPLPPSPPQFKAHKSPVACCCFVGDVLYTAANRVRSWGGSSSSSMTMLCELDLGSRVTNLFHPPDSPHLWACCDDGRIGVLSLDMQLISCLHNSKKAVTCIASVLSPSLPSSSLIWVGRSDGSLNACS